MILEALRLITTALEDDDYGVNAKLDSMGESSEFGSDAQPPDVKKVLNATEDDVVAKGSVGSDWPVLVLSQGAPAELDGIPSQGLRMGLTVPIMLAYVTREADGAQSTRHALYTMRAVLKTLGSMFDGDAATRRTLQSVLITNVNSVRVAALEESLEDGATVLAGLVANVQARDESAT